MASTLNTSPPLAVGALRVLLLGVVGGALDLRLFNSVLGREVALLVVVCIRDSLESWKDLAIIVLDALGDFAEGCQSVLSSHRSL